jgi:hypothetical protein
MDCSIWIASQFGGLNCDLQSILKIGLWNWIVNPAFRFQSKSKNIISIKRLTFHDGSFFRSKAKLVKNNANS